MSSFSATAGVLDYLKIALSLAQHSKNQGLQRQHLLFARKACRAVSADYVSVYACTLCKAFHVGVHVQGCGPLGRVVVALSANLEHPTALLLSGCGWVGSISVPLGCAPAAALLAQRHLIG
jgi:hypothetical protein